MHRLLQNHCANFDPTYRKDNFCDESQSFHFSNKGPSPFLRLNDTELEKSILTLFEIRHNLEAKFRRTLSKSNIRWKTRPFYKTRKRVTWKIIFFTTTDQLQANLVYKVCVYKSGKHVPICKNQSFNCCLLSLIMVQGRLDQVCSLQEPLIRWTTCSMGLLFIPVCNLTCGIFSQPNRTPGWVCAQFWLSIKCVTGMSGLMADSLAVTAQIASNRWANVG